MQARARGEPRGPRAPVHRRSARQRTRTNSSTRRQHLRRRRGLWWLARGTHVGGARGGGGGRKQTAWRGRRGSRCHAGGAAIREVAQQALRAAMPAWDPTGMAWGLSAALGLVAAPDAAKLRRAVAMARSVGVAAATVASAEAALAELEKHEEAKTKAKARENAEKLLRAALPPPCCRLQRWRTQPSCTRQSCSACGRRGGGDGGGGWTKLSSA